MTRQHFQAIAEALRLSEASDETINAIIDVCIKFNNQFDQSKFREACNSAYSSHKHYKKEAC